MVAEKHTPVTLLFSEKCKKNVNKGLPLILSYTSSEQLSTRLPSLMIKDIMILSKKNDF